MNARDAQTAVAGGVALVCATCDHYWAARVLDPEGSACSQGDCTGPLRGGSFARYRGPLRDFARWCLRCGDPADGGAVRALGETRAFGLCRVHLREFVAFVPESGASSPIELLGPQGLLSPAALVRRKNPVVRILEELDAERG